MAFDPKLAQRLKDLGVITEEMSSRLAPAAAVAPEQALAPMPQSPIATPGIVAPGSRQPIMNTAIAQPGQFDQPIQQMANAPMVEEAPKPQPVVSSPLSPELQALKSGQTAKKAASLVVDPAKGLDSVNSDIERLAQEREEVLAGADDRQIANWENRTGFDSKMEALLAKKRSIESGLPPAAAETAAAAGELVSDTPAAKSAQEDALARRQGRVANLESGYDIQQEAIMKGAAAGAAQAAAESAHLQGTYDAAEAMRKTEQARELQRQSRLEENMQKLQTKLDEYDASPATASESFARSGLGSKIGQGISLFLGAAPNSSGQNTALKVLQDEVQSDLNKQKQGIANRATVYGDMLNTFKDERAAMAGAQIQYINNAQLKLNQIASQYKGPQIKANAEKLFGELEVLKQGKMIEFENAVNNSAGMSQADEMTKSIMRLPENLRAKALEEAGTKKELENGVGSINDSFKQVNSIGGVSGNIPFTQSKAAVDAARSTIMATLVANWKGPMSDSDMKRIDGLMPSVTDTTAQTETKRIAMENMLRSKAKATPILDGFGITPKPVTERFKTLKRQ